MSTTTLANTQTARLQIGPPTLNEAKEAMKLLRFFISPGQLYTLAECCQGEEGAWFRQRLCDLAAQIKAMPKTYEQDGLGDESLAFLHYFAGGQANWWITEKDMGTEEDPNTQHQAFGLADLFNDGGEVGYISIVELMANEAELDLHFDVKPLSFIRKQREEARHA